MTENTNVNAEQAAGATTPEAAESPAAAAPAPVTAPAPRPAVNRTPPDGHWWWGTGRRKTAVARVRLRPGDGKFLINKRPHADYFTEERDRNDTNHVLEVTNTKGSVDVHVNVSGGGFTGQAGAVVLGLARALRGYDETLEPILRDHGLLTRDPRKVERKKYGQPGARKRFQFSKR
jgi:small subunit ribosomal protein S9